MSAYVEKGGIFCRFKNLFNLMEFVMKSEPINLQSFQVNFTGGSRSYNIGCLENLERFIESELFGLIYEVGEIFFENAYEVVFGVRLLSYNIDGSEQMSDHELISNVQCELQISSTHSPYSFFMRSIHFTEYEFFANQSVWCIYDNEDVINEFVGQCIKEGYRMFKFFDSSNEFIKFCCSKDDALSYIIAKYIIDDQMNYMIIRIGSYLEPITVRNLLFNRTVTEIKQNAYRKNVATYFGSDTHEMRNSLTICRSSELLKELEHNVLDLNEKLEEEEEEK